MSKTIRAISALFIFCVGWVSGPVLAAIIFSAGAVEDDPYELLESRRLVSASQTLESTRYFLSIAPPPGGSECGYDPDVLFPSRSLELENVGNPSPYWVYEDAFFRRYREVSRVKDLILASEIRRAFSPFEIEFLTRCIKATLLSSWCSDKLNALRSRAKYERHPFYEGVEELEEDHFCSLVDGLAARKGLKLADPKKRDLY